MGGRVNTIYTDSGKFTIRFLLDPADSPRKGWLNIIHAKEDCFTELTNEIKSRAPHAKITYAPFVRPS